MEVAAVATKSKHFSKIQDERALGSKQKYCTVLYCIAEFLYVVRSPSSLAARYFAPNHYELRFAQLIMDFLILFNNDTVCLLT